MRHNYGEKRDKHLRLCGRGNLWAFKSDSTLPFPGFWSFAFLGPVGDGLSMFFCLPVRNSKSCTELSSCFRSRYLARDGNSKYEVFYPNLLFTLPSPYYLTYSYPHNSNVIIHKVIVWNGDFEIIHKWQNLYFEKNSKFLIST